MNLAVLEALGVGCLSEWLFGKILRNFIIHQFFFLFTHLAHLSKRMCTELGMHKEALSEMDFASPINEDEWVEKESRRRLFWQIYIIDM